MLTIVLNRILLVHKLNLLIQGNFSNIKFLIIKIIEEWSLLSFGFTSEKDKLILTLDNIQ